MEKVEKWITRSDYEWLKGLEVGEVVNKKLWELGKTLKPTGIKNYLLSMSSKPYTIEYHNTKEIPSVFNTLVLNPLVFTAKSHVQPLNPPSEEKWSLSVYGDFLTTSVKLSKEEEEMDTKEREILKSIERRTGKIKDLNSEKVFDLYQKEIISRKELDLLRKELSKEGFKELIRENLAKEVSGLETDSKPALQEKETVVQLPSPSRDDIDNLKAAFVMVCPHFGKYLNRTSVINKHEHRFVNLVSFLLGVKGRNKKNMVLMGKDYFECLSSFFTNTLHLKSFRMLHIDSKLGKKLYLEFVKSKGNNYWEAPKVDSGKRWLPDTYEKDIRNIPQYGGVVIHSGSTGGYLGVKEVE